MIEHARELVLLTMVTGLGILGSCVPSRRGPEPLPPDATEHDTAEMEARIADARERRGDHYANRLALFLEDTPRREPGGTVFIGASLTERFPLEQAFSGRNVINRGIGGDKIDGVLERMDVSVSDLSPSRIYLLIGTNNVLWPDGQGPGELAESYEKLIEEMKAAAPDAEIIVQPILPLGTGREDATRMAVQVNALLSQVAARQEVEWLDIYPRFTNRDGMLRDELTTDGVHLTLLGYLVWLEALMPPGELADAAAGLATEWHAMHGNPARIDGWNRDREENDLIVYTRDTGNTTTGTNQWGVEAAVSNGRVVAAGGNNLEIPADGFVVSGHGSSAAWVSANLRPGTEVSLDGDTVAFAPVPFGSLEPREKLDRLMSLLFNAIAQSTDSPPARREHVDLMTRLYNLREGREPVDESTLRTLYARLMGMQ